MIKRNFWFCNEEVKGTLYKVLVRLKLEYVSSVWDPDNALINWRNYRDPLLAFAKEIDGLQELLPW
jgi:hypothetical protein